MNLLCWLGFHKLMFAYRPGNGQKLIRVQCVRKGCDYIADQFWEDIDEEGNVNP